MTVALVGVTDRSDERLSMEELATRKRAGREGGEGGDDEAIGD